MSYFKPHSIKQEKALYSEKKIIAVASGIQWGKTSIGSIITRKALQTHHHVDDNYIIAAPTYKILKQSTYPAFIRTFGNIGKYQSTDAVYKIPNGPSFYFRTGTQPDSIVGITNVRLVWLDEAGKFSLYFWENAQARASFKDCPIVLTTSPYTLNWFYKDLIRPYMKGNRHDEIELIQAASYENPYFPKAEYDRRKLTMDPRRFGMMYGGEWNKNEGLVFDCFDSEFNSVVDYNHMPGTYYLGMIDWGFNDPFVVKIWAITPEGNIYDVSEFYKTGLRQGQVIEVIKMKNQVFKPTAFYCDPSRPDYIMELQSMGIPALPADNNIHEGIEAYYEMIKTRRYKIVGKNCPYTIDELETYHYPDPDDLKPDQDNKNDDKPVDQNNHVMDCHRYGALAIKKYHSGHKFNPTSPEEHSNITPLTQSKRLERLMKKSNDNSEERFS